MKIIYVYDALCGWCYGFSPVITDFESKYSKTLKFEVISGGMITGSKIGPIGDVAPYISWAYKEVENTTGVKFGKDFLDKTLKDGEVIFTSIPTAIALSVFKELNQSNSLQFATKLQSAIYYNGIEPENFEEYGNIASKYGIDSASFVRKMREPRYSRLAEDDFKKTSALGVTGFPTILLEIDGVHHKIGNGYMPFSKLENHYLTIINN